MFTSILTLTPFLIVALFPLVIRTRFSSAELLEMGVCLENLESAPSDYFIDRPDCLLPKAQILCGNA